MAVRVAYRMVPCPPRLTLSRYDEYAAPCSRVADVTDSKQHSDPLEVLAAIISPLNHLSQDHGEGARRNLAAVREHIRHLEEQVQALEAACDHHRMFWQKAEERERGLKEQLEAAETRKQELWTRLLDMEGKYLDAANTLAHAEEFIEHQDMSYRWAEWCEGRDPAGVSEPETTEASDGTVPGTPGLDGSAERLSRPPTSGSETSSPASRSVTVHWDEHGQMQPGPVPNQESKP